MPNKKKIILEFPDGSKKEYHAGIKGMDIAKEISEGLARNTFAMKIDEELFDINDPILKSGKIRLITWKDNEGKEIFRHSAAHLFAHALLRKFPDAKIAIGPAIENGFYYDFQFSRAFTPEDLTIVEEEMKKIVNEKIPIVKKEIPKKQALELFKNNKFKIEMISEIESEKIRVYEQGDFVDFCRGPHVPNTGMIKAFKLTKVSGAYWKGNAENEQLQRVYGVAFQDKKELEEYLKHIEEAEKRDHRKIGKELNLFSFHEEGPGFPFFKNKGMIMWNILLDYWRKVHKKNNYLEIKTPIMLNKSLWERSGHWTNYKNNMYTLKIDSQEFAVKPMNCPGGMLVYNEEVHSYKELPLRVAEIGLVHRHEASGVLSGLFRVRCFHQDDAHIFMRESQIKEEILGVLKLAEEMYSIFGLSYHLELSTRPKESIGTDEAWEISTNALKEALEETGKSFKINEGDGAFYGPKIDIHIKDAIGRTWQCGTIQLDMNLPERFDLYYIDETGQKKRPVMIHRVIYGSLERFFGIIVEHYAGKFPLWLNPVQVKLLPIADRHVDYCKNIMKIFAENNIRAEINDKAETTSKKVREAQLEQVNYILVVGDKEIENKTVNVRTRDEKIIGEMKVEEFIKKIEQEIKEFK